MSNPEPPNTKPPGPWKRLWDWFDPLPLVWKTLGLLALTALVIWLGVVLLSNVVDDGDFGGSADQLDSYLAEFGGDRDVYIRIMTTTSCSRLDDELAEARSLEDGVTDGSQDQLAATGYMSAIEDRSEAIGCT